MKQTQLFKENDEEIMREQLLSQEELFMLKYLDSFNRESNRLLDEEEFSDFELDFE